MTDEIIVTDEVVAADEAVTTEEIIKVVQLPEIAQQLEGVKARITQKVEYALSLPCTEETYKEIKELKAELNAEFKEIEALRIAIKKQILAPYEEFERIYKENITDVFKPGERELNDRITAVTDGIKKEKYDIAAAHFAECCEAHGIDFLKFDDCGLVITMTISNKKIKESVAAFVNGVAKDLEMINTQEFADEILVEYKKTFDVSASILKVTNHHKEVEAERQRREKLRQIEEERKAQVAKVEQEIIDEYEENAEQGSFFSAPVAVAEEEEDEDEAPAPTAPELVSTSFKVVGTMEQLKALIKYMKENDIHYERI